MPSTWGEAMKLAEINGVTIAFVRRRYSKQTYTWLHWKDEAGVWHEYGDPWPSVVVPKAQLAEAVQKIKDGFKGIDAAYHTEGMTI